MSIIYVDIDETICNTPFDPNDNELRVYEKSEPIQEHIEKINKLYEEGNTIVYWTARGSKTKIDWYDLTKSQLERWGAKHHELRCDKPYYDLFVEDRSALIENL